MTDASGEGEDAKAVAAKRQLFWLKMLVGGLGLLIALSMLAIIGRVIYLVSRPKPGPAPSIAVPLKLPDGAAMGTMAISRDHLAVRYQHNGKTLIEIRDIRTGELVRRFEVQAE